MLKTHNVLNKSLRNVCLRSPCAQHQGGRVPAADRCRRRAQKSFALQAGARGAEMLETHRVLNNSLRK
eukprot:13474436-Alexandrium_andersonii.AAC.1